MKKIKGLLVMPTIIVIVVTFFGGIAFAAIVTRVNKEKEDVFVDDGEISGLIMGTNKCFFLPPGEQLVDSIVQEISDSESVVEKNRELVLQKDYTISTESRTGYYPSGETHPYIVVLKLNNWFGENVVLKIEIVYYYQTPEVLVDSVKEHIKGVISSEKLSDLIESQGSFTVNVHFVN